jgi:hypothetical protein
MLFGGVEMRGRRNLSTIGVGIATTLAVVLLVASCSGSSSKAGAPKPTTANTSTPTSTVTQVVVGQNDVKVLTGTATGSSPCEKAAPTPLSPGQVGAGAGGSTDASPTDVAASEHGARGMVQQQPLSQSERQALEGQMATARTVAQTYPTVADALKAGYAKSTPFVPCIGAHYTNYALARSFDPAHPSELLYDGTQPNSKIVGLSYLVYHPNGQPPGFAGNNDHWHQHNANGGLCLKGGLVVGDESTTRAECTARGGRKALLIDIWMLHAWIVPGFECTWGTFSGECPELGGRLCGNAWESPDPKDVSQCGAQLG